jgi:hypothetical protein
MSSSQNRSRSPQSRADLLAILTLATVGVIAILTFRDYGLGWDDLTHAQYGEALLDLYRSGFANREALSFVNLYLYGGGFDMLAALVHKVSPFNLFETRRLTGAAVGLFGLFITWRLSRRIGGVYAGLVGVLLLAICPLFYGQMFMNPKDAPFAVAMALLLLSLAKAFEEYPQPSPANVALFGVGLGLTLGSRIIGGLAAFYAAAALSLIVIEETRIRGWRQGLRRATTFTTALLPGLVLAYLLWAWFGHGRLSRRSTPSARLDTFQNSSKSPGKNCSPDHCSPWWTCRAVTYRRSSYCRCRKFSSRFPLPALSWPSPQPSTGSCRSRVAPHCCSLPWRPRFQSPSSCSRAPQCITASGILFF